MLYDNYQKRIRKIAAVMSKVVRMLPLILSVTAVVIVTSVTLMATKGIVGKLECAAEFTYGDSVKCDASAFLSDVSYEFRADGENAWSSKTPRDPGKYQVRAVGRTTFGGQRYGDPETFTILPRKITVSVSDKTVVYGEELSVEATLAYDDKIACDSFIYEAYSTVSGGASDDFAEKASVEPDTEAIKITDSDGNDVTDSYIIETNKTDLTVNKRDISVTVEDKSYTYTGKACYYNVYALTDGTMRDGDELIATFGALTDVGSIINLPSLAVLNKDSKDVTKYYNIKTSIGTLSVEKRPLSITTDDFETVYSGEEITHAEYDVNPSTTLAEGHKIIAEQGFAPTVVGTHDNILRFRVFDEADNDVSENYAISVSYGTITINKRPITIVTGSGSWVYDGEKHSNLACSSEELVTGHKAEAGSYDQTAWVENVGVYSNMFEAVIMDSEGNKVTSNYEISYKYGTLEITVREMTVTTLGTTFVYDGTHQSYPECVSEGMVATHKLRALNPPTIRDPGMIKNEFKVSVLDKNNEDVSENYKINYICESFIEITKRPVTVETVSSEWIYDGEPHSATGYIILSELRIADGETLTLIGCPSITTAGTVENKCTGYKITRLSDYGTEEDATDFYIIKLGYGFLTVHPRPIVIKPVDETKIYDGTPLYPKAIELDPSSEYGLVNGHTITATLIGSKTDVGQSSSRLTDPIVMSGPDNVTENYAIKARRGILIVDPRPITVLTGSAEKHYDGTPLTCDTFEISPNSKYPLVEGHKLYVKNTGSQTEVGESDNICDELYTYIASSDGKVTRNYEISYELGTLVVKPYALLYITSASDWKFYDGTPLTNENYELLIEDGEIHHDHNLQVNVYGSITEPGIAPNELTVRIFDKNGKDVSDKYGIFLTQGVLEVKEKPDDGGEEGGDVPGGGSGGPGLTDKLPISGPDPDYSEGKIVFGKIKTGKAAHIYLRQSSYGVYDGQSWGIVSPYGPTLPNGYSYNYLASIALKNAGAYADTAEFSELELYMLPYYIGFNGDYEIQASDTVYSGNKQNFTAYFYSMLQGTDYASLKGNLGEYAAYEEEYRKYVYMMYLSLDNETRHYMNTIISEQNFDVSDPQIIDKVARYIQNSAKYNLKYDTNLDTESNIAIAFLDKYKEGVCVHYATAATLLYRALGIPARYVVGFTVSTQAGEFVEIRSPGHAWVEVYIDGVGWLPVEVTGSGDGEGGVVGGGGAGIGPDSKEKIEITPSYQYKTFDGLVLKADPEKIDICASLADLLKRGYSYSVSVAGSQLEIGIGVSVIESFVLFDPNGVDVTDNYEIIYHDGILEVFPPNQNIIKLYLYQLQKYYDGKPLYFTKDDYEIIEMEEGLELDVSFNISLTDVGYISLAEINKDVHSYVDYRVYKDGIDVTSGYVLVFEKFEGMSDSYVPIRIDKRNIVFTAASAVKVYDGTPLENETAVISRGTLVSGHTFTAFVDGSITSIGETLNVIIKVVIYDGTEDVTDNYNLEFISGVLTVISSDE